MSYGKKLKHSLHLSSDDGFSCAVSFLGHVGEVQYTEDLTLGVGSQEDKGQSSLAQSGEGPKNENGDIFGVDSSESIKGQHKTLR